MFAFPRLWLAPALQALLPRVATGIVTGKSRRRMTMMTAMTLRMWSAQGLQGMLPGGTTGAAGLRPRKCEAVKVHVRVV
jgi:hypothetical protein